MTDHDPKMENHDAESQKSKKRFLQVDLISILMLMLACAVWLAYARTRSDIAEVKSELQGLRQIARELVVENPNQYAAIQAFPSSYQELIWNVYVPESDTETFQLCLVMDEIAENESFAPGERIPLKKIRIQPGEHSVQLRYDVGDEFADLTVLVDGQPAIEERRVSDWIKTSGYSSSSVVDGTTKSFSTDAVLTLLARRFSISYPGGSIRAPREPSGGIMLWVESVPSATD